MKMIYKQCGYYMYLLIFKARAFLVGKSARVHGLSFECVVADLFSCESSTGSEGSKRCCLSFQLPASLEDKQVTIILGVRPCSH